VYLREETASKITTQAEDQRFAARCLPLLIVWYVLCAALLLVAWMLHRCHLQQLSKTFPRNFNNCKLQTAGNLARNHHHESLHLHRIPLVVLGDESCFRISTPQSHNSCKFGIQTLHVNLSVLHRWSSHSRRSGSRASTSKLLRWCSWILWRHPYSCLISGWLLSRCNVYIQNQNKRWRIEYLGETCAWILSFQQFACVLALSEYHCIGNNCSYSCVAWKIQQNGRDCLHDDEKGVWVWIVRWLSCRSIYYQHMCMLLLICFISLCTYDLFYSVTVRWSFLCSLFCFLGMIASRLLIEFDLLKKDTNGGDSKNKKEIALLVVCSLGALATHLLSYVNQNLWCWQSLIGMTIYLGKVCVRCCAFVFCT